MMPTVFGALRGLGADPSVAAAVQWPVSTVAVATAVWLFLNDRSRSGRTFALLCATFLVSPYGFDYDMGALAVAAAIILALRSYLDRISAVTLTAVAMLPAFVLPLGSVGAPLHRSWLPQLFSGRSGGFWRPAAHSPTVYPANQQTRDRAQSRLAEATEAPQTKQAEN